MSFGNGLSADLMAGTGISSQAAEYIGASALTTVTTAGTTQGTATLIPPSVTNVSLTTAGSQTGAILSSSVPLERSVMVRNSTSTSGVVYPPSGGSFNSGSANAGFTVAQNESIIITRKTTTLWSVVSTANPSILGSANTWTGVNVFSDRVFLRMTNPAFTQTQGAPTAKTVTSAITAAELLTGIITTTGATGPSIHQLPTGTLLAAAITGIAVGDSFDWSLINTGTGASNDATITVNTDHTIVGNPTAGALTDATIISGSALFRTRYTAANTFVTYRLA
jgi:hypothetical protein